MRYITFGDKQAGYLLSVKDIDAVEYCNGEITVTMTDEYEKKTGYGICMVNFNIPKVSLWSNKLDYESDEYKQFVTMLETLKTILEENS